MNKKYMQFLGKTTDAYELLEFLDKEGFVLSSPIEIKKILDFLEIPYSLKPDFKGIKLDGKISIQNNEPLIWMNPMKISTEERQRFTLAHELGHFFLHIAPSENPLSQKNNFEDKTISFNRDTNWTYKEMEANQFASQLLMPISIVEKELKNILSVDKSIKDDELLEKLAKIFFVSQIAMRYRLKNMGVEL